MSSSQDYHHSECNAATSGENGATTHTITGTPETLPVVVESTETSVSAGVDENGENNYDTGLFSFGSKTLPLPVVAQSTVNDHTGIDNTNTVTTNMEIEVEHRHAKKPKTNNRMTFAPSVKDYLKQARKRDGDSELLELKYLPRPEWCRTVVALIVEDFNLFTPSETSKSEAGRITMWSVMAGTLSEAFQILIRQCTHDYQEPVLDETGTNIVSYSRYHPNPQKLDMFNSHIKQNAIYFDMKNYVWKTKQIEDTSSTNTTPTLSSDTDDHETQSTFEALLRPPRPRRQTFGKDEDSILHMAIKENATNLAIDIIRIEYNTLRDCAHRCDCIKMPFVFLTLLQTSNLKGMTPIILAAQKGNLIVVQELLRCGAWSCTAAQNGTTAILQAAHFGHCQVIECIIDDYLHAVPICDILRPSTLIELIDKPSSNGTTALMRAAQEGHLSTVELLLKHGALVNQRNNAQMTTLMLAAQRGHSQICRVLIDHGANVNCQTNQNSTALLLATKRGHVAVVKVLVAASCELHQPDNRNRTALQIVQRRIQRHIASAEAGTVAQNQPTIGQNRNLHRRDGQNNHNNENQDRGDNQIGDDEEEDNDNNSNFVSHRTDQKLLYLLDPENQNELIQFAVRAKRSYEMIRMYTLIQQNRADVKIKHDSKHLDVPTVIKLLSKVTSDTIDRDNRCSQLNDKALIRTMLLPVPLIQTIALFLPLPPLWDERITRIQLRYGQSNPNAAIVYTLDVIDEILEEGGFLAACAEAKVPAPVPYLTWDDWKRSAKPKATWNAQNIETRRNEPFNITESLPPRPRDENNPSICELRRQVGYLPLLHQYQSHTTIAEILMQNPYRMPEYFLRGLIHVADVASICRRCCLWEDLSPSPPAATPISSNPAVQFSSETAESISELARNLSYWYRNERLP